MFAALLWALVTFSLQPAISVGIFFELLWLDLFPAGTFIPPHGLLSLCATLGVLACLPDPDMRTTALVVVLTLPLGYLGAWMEQRYRKRQNLSYNSLILWNRRGVSHPFTPDRLVIQALAEIFAMNLALFLASSSAVLVIVRLAQPLLAGGPQPGWPMLWIAAAAGAILALRMRRAYALAGATLVIGILATL
jgi:PTS system mannose-specific IIC component